MSDLSKPDLVHPDETCSALISHSLIRASYSLSVVQKRILNVLFAQVQIRGKDFEPIEVPEDELASSIGTTPNNYDYIKNSIKILKKEAVDISIGADWRLFDWITSATFNSKKHTYTFKLNEELMPYILDFKKNFTLISQYEINKLQSKYSLRIYELIMANIGFAGKKGNPANTWFTDLEFDQLRQLFKIPTNEYKQTADFRKKIIDASIKEINERNVGLCIVPDYEIFRYKKRLYGVRLICKWLGKDTKVANRKKTMAEIEDEKWVESNKELYEKIRKEIKLLPWIPGDSDYFKDVQAIKELKEHPKAVKPKTRMRKPTAKT